MAIGHRVVHGGPDYSAPDPDRRRGARAARAARAAGTFASAQQSGARSARSGRAIPQIPQVACFDTAFHRRHPEVADRFAIAERWYAEGVRRYGFHGLSYEYVADRLREHDPALAEGRVVVCHLGSGASMCAIHDGRSMDSTMGFTAVDGLPMGTRTGQLDPGVVLYLMQSQGFTAEQVERFLYHEGGLKGLSGVSNDMRDLEASDAPGARLAIDYFVYRIVRETGALAAAMGGIDGLVFTAGIGEHSPTDPRPRRRAPGLARCGPRSGRQRREPHRHLQPRQRAAGHGGADQRRADDRAPHAAAAPTGRLTGGSPFQTRAGAAGWFPSDKNSEGEP